MGSADVRENVPPPATDGGSWRSDLSDLQTTVCSDEEWVESAEETSSSASTSSKQHQSRENDHPRNVPISRDDLIQPTVVAPPLGNWEGHNLILGRTSTST
ncbi:hypothetical protein PC116_g1507 [Phytophthora cactorum]|uniref:Uncharacterized protein n=1 Tax=Phytophthora cactorum TaxID=29920 RepID=A0A329RRV4_9STRA|nr:hypothetical protein Pcac1_g19472 [Phytophthora cactorum]KAG2933025.1 hypothetical protein PC117_g12950 [Phytophthora cactorum]KAG2940390.1 hypothetical protein PC115_g2600 [Phytophthora cactorum]KAG3054233.1 hypothetical protein PC121_g16395 [Phytophthora cactorum]KAG3189647.1 hypothetical protein C6341_g2125 [Phytophthora cactorum]